MSDMNDLINKLTYVFRESLWRELAVVRRGTKKLEAYFATTSPTDEDIRQVLQEAVQTQFGGEDISIWVEDVISADNMVVYRRIESDGDSQLWIVEYEISEKQQGVIFGEPKPTMRVTRYEFDDGDSVDTPSSPTPIFRQLSQDEL